MKNVDLLNGNITKSIFSYAIPLVIGSVMQVFFNMADQIVLGQMAGSVALASVGACAQVTGIIVNFFVGLSAGVGIVLARYIGMGDKEYSKKIISTAFVASIGLGLFAASIAYPLAKPLLNITRCPSECYDGAFTYANIYYSGIPGITVYNFCAAVIRTTGDSKRPTIYMIIAGATNLLLNIILCFIMQNKVAAVALATDIAQLLGAVLCIIRLVRMQEDYRLELKHLTFKFVIFGKIMRYGIPSGFCSCLYNIANIQVQAGINSYGTDAIAGHSAAASIESLIAPFIGSFSTTVSTMVGQNAGAGNKDRVRKSIYYSMGYSVSIVAVLSVIVYLLRVPLIGLYAPGNPGVIEYAAGRMQWVLLWMSLHAFYNMYSAALNAFGYSSFVMLSNIFSTVVFRTFWMQLVYPRHETYIMIMMCYTVSWGLMAIGNTSAFAYVYGRYKKGYLRKI